MSPVNAIVDPSYDEEVFRLAVGLRLVDGVRGGRPITDIAVVREDVPQPHRLPRPGPAGIDPGIGLPELPARRSGRYAFVYPVKAKPLRGEVEERFVVARVFHRDRRFAPRRLRLNYEPEQDVADEDRDSRTPPYPPVKRRGRAVALFPGSAYETSGLTGVRGRVEKGAGGAPVPFARVWAAAEGSTRREAVGHADDRGEFLLLLRSTNALVGPTITLQRTLLLHAAEPTAAASSPTLVPGAPAPTRQNPPDPATADPFLFLPVETLPPLDAADRVSPGMEADPLWWTESPRTKSVTFQFGRVVSTGPFTL